MIKLSWYVDFEILCFFVSEVCISIKKWIYIVIFFYSYEIINGIVMVGFDYEVKRDVFVF